MVATKASARLDRLRGLLGEAGVDAVLLLNPPDVCYFTGTRQPANLLVPADTTREPILFVRRARDFVEADIAATGFPAEWVADGGSFREITAHLRRIGLTAGVLGTAEDKLPTTLFQSLQRALPEWELRDISAILLRQRMVKDAEEIALMRQASALFAVGHQAILATARPGVSELEVALAAFTALRLAGHEEFIPMRRWDAVLPPAGVLASGPNLWRISGQAFTVTGVGISAAVPAGASRRRLEPGDLIVFDMPTHYQGYHGDTARTYVVGESTAGQRRAFDDCLAVYQATTAVLRPGITAEEVYAVARAAAQETPYGPYFMGYAGKQGAYIGHGTGIEQDEPPVLAPRVTTPIQVGMTLAIEPKFIIPDFGAIDIEDTWLITDVGCELLHDHPNELFIVG